MSHPVLYSFRRCPYAIRARLALRVSAVQVVLREVVLADKPESLRSYSTKATVPVLVVDDLEVIDESLDIMMWALQQHDPQGWLLTDDKLIAESKRLITTNDIEFKPWLDRYKYADRFPEYPMTYYRDQAEVFLSRLEELLARAPFLLGEASTLADMAIFPFIRQLANTDKQWFENSSYPCLQAWLETLLQLPLFTSVMDKYPQWKAGDPDMIF